MNKEQYLNEIIGQIKNGVKAADIKREIGDHIDDRASYYFDCGFSSDEAEAKAIEHMGDPKKIGEELSRVDKSTNIIPIIALIALLAFSLWLSFYTYSNAEAMMNLVDPDWVKPLPCLISILAFASNAVCYFYCVKNGAYSLLYILGGANITAFIISAFPPLINCTTVYVPMEYTIIGFVFDFLPEILGLTSYIHGFFNSDIGPVSMLALFAISLPFTVFIVLSCFKAAEKLKNASLGKEIRADRMKKISKALLIISAASFLAFSIEVGFDYMSREEYNYFTSKHYYEEAYEYILSDMQKQLKESRTIFDCIELPLTYEQARKLAIENGVSPEKIDNDEYSREFIDIFPAFGEHFFRISLYNFDSDEIFETKILNTSSLAAYFSQFEKPMDFGEFVNTNEKFENIDETFTPERVIDEYYYFLEEYEVTQGESVNTKITLASSETYFCCLEFENGEFKNKTIDSLDIDSIKNEEKNAVERFFSRLF